MPTFTLAQVNTILWSSLTFVLHLLTCTFANQNLWTLPAASRTESAFMVLAFASSTFAIGLILIKYNRVLGLLNSIFCFICITVRVAIQTNTGRTTSKLNIRDDWHYGILWVTFGTSLAAVLSQLMIRKSCILISRVPAKLLIVLSFMFQVLSTNGYTIRQQNTNGFVPVFINDTALHIFQILAALATGLAGINIFVSLFASVKRIEFGLSFLQFALVTASMSYLMSERNFDANSSPRHEFTVCTHLGWWAFGLSLLSLIANGIPPTRGSLDFPSVDPLENNHGFDATVSAIPNQINI